jgi:hypothetical protein
VRPTCKHARRRYTCLIHPDICQTFSAYQGCLSHSYPSLSALACALCIWA